MSTKAGVVMLGVRRTAGSHQAKGVPIHKALKHALQGRERIFRTLMAALLECMNEPLGLRGSMTGLLLPRVSPAKARP